jgi:hypothetical protein
MLSNQKLALLGFAVAAALVVLGRWGVSHPGIRERDVAAIFAGGVVAGLAVVRFITQWRDATRKPPPNDPAALPAKSKG